MIIEIINQNGKWLINGKKYTELCGAEKLFFEEFIAEMKVTMNINLAKEPQNKEYGKI